MSTQLCQYLICDLLRAGATHAEGPAPAVRSFDHTIAVLKLSGLAGNASAATRQSQRTIRLHNQQFNIPCMRKEFSGLCSAAEGERSTYEYLVELLRNHSRRSANPSGRSFVIFNYGLHLKEKTRSWSVPSMVRALVDVATEFRHKNVTFLYRETSAQTFSYSDGECVLVGKKKYV